MFRFKNFSSAKVLDKSEAGAEPQNLKFSGRGGEIEATFFGTGKGPLTVLKPGWGCQSGYFRHQVKALSAIGDVLVITNRGMGGTSIGDSIPKSYISDCAADMAQVLRAMGVKGFHAVGHSMGGQVLVHFADMFGEEFSIKSMVLFAPILMQPSESLPSGLTSLASRMALAGLDARVKHDCDYITKESMRLVRLILHANRLATAMQTADKGKAIRCSNREFFSSIMLLDPYAIATGLQGMKEAGDRTFDAFERLRVPALVLGGEYDAFVTPDISHIARSLNLTVCADMINNASHFLHLERPELVNRKMVEFQAAHSI